MNSLKHNTSNVFNSFQGWEPKKDVDYLWISVNNPCITMNSLLTMENVVESIGSGTLINSGFRHPLVPHHKARL